MWEGKSVPQASRLQVREGGGGKGPSETRASKRDTERPKRGTIQTRGCCESVCEDEKGGRREERKKWQHTQHTSYTQVREREKEQNKTPEHSTEIKKRQGELCEERKSSRTGGRKGGGAGFFRTSSAEIPRRRGEQERAGTRKRGKSDKRCRGDCAPPVDGAASEVIRIHGEPLPPRQQTRPDSRLAILGTESFGRAWIVRFPVTQVPHLLHLFVPGTHCARSSSLSLPIHSCKFSSCLFRPTLRSSSLSLPFAF